MPDESLPESGLLPPDECINWTGCDAVERVPGKVSGVPILRGTRVQADAVWINHQSGCIAEEIADMFDLDVAQARAVIDHGTRETGRKLLIMPDTPSEFSLGDAAINTAERLRTQAIAQANVDGPASSWCIVTRGTSPTPSYYLPRDVDRLRKWLATGHRVVIAVGAAVDSHNDDHRDAARVAEVYELHDGREIKTWVGRALHRAVAAIVADSGK